MEGKCHQSRSRSVAKNPKPKQRDTSRFSFEKKQQNGSSSSNGRQQRQQQQQQQGSIMRKQKKKREEVNKAHHQLNKDDMQLTIENIMLLSGDS